MVILKTFGGTYIPSKKSVKLLNNIGGPESILNLTTTFYEHFKADSHINQFMRNSNDPHETRLANWIVEKMGQGTPWTEEREQRNNKPAKLAQGRLVVVSDRTTAHVAAWHSPKRDSKNIGKRFNLHDSRVWMRLMFWSARENGLLDNKPFTDWFLQFIGHFVRIYESTAPSYAIDSLQWSESQSNIEEYENNGHVMHDLE